jgi:hypothetical protein
MGDFSNAEKSPAKFSTCFRYFPAGDFSLGVFSPARVLLKIMQVVFRILIFHPQRSSVNVVIESESTS